MKKAVLKKSSLLSVCMLFILLFTSCEKDLYDEAIIVAPKATSQKISMDQVLSEISNPIIKNYITNELPLELGFSEFRTTSEAYFNFIKIIKENDYITYTFLVNEYDEGKPYLKYFIITKEDGIEKAGFATYIPDSQIENFDVTNFTGKIQISNLQQDVKGETQFVNSQPIFTPQGITCANSLSLIAHSCGLEGNHAPGEPCEDGVIRSYWEIIVVVTCSGQTDEFLAAPSQFMGENSGGGSITINANVMVFLNGLNDDQLAVLQNNPSLITYLEENDASQESTSFVLQLITIAITKGGIITIDNTINSSDALSFDSVEEFNNFLDTINEDDMDFELEQNQTQRTAKVKVQLVGIFGGIEIKIKQTTAPYTVSEVLSDAYGFTVAFDWEQTASNFSINGNVVTVNIYGKIHYNCIIDGMGTIFTSTKHYQIKINKATGAVISAVKIN